MVLFRTLLIHCPAPSIYLALYFRIPINVYTFPSGYCGRRMKWLKLKQQPSLSSTTTLCSSCWWWWAPSSSSSQSLPPTTMCSAPWERPASSLSSPPAHSRGSHHLSISFSWCLILCHQCCGVVASPWHFLYFFYDVRLCFIINVLLF